MDTNNSSSPSQAADGKYCVEECCCNNYLIGHWGFSPGTPNPCKIFQRWLLSLSNSYTDRTSQYFWLITMISGPLISYQWHRHVSILPPKALSVITHSFQARLLKTRCTIQRWVWVTNFASQSVSQICWQSVSVLTLWIFMNISNF